VATTSTFAPARPFACAGFRNRGWCRSSGHFRNDHHARFNREFLAERGIFAVNLVSSPGSGKTTLLTGQSAPQPSR
jgi:hypothetical protein